MFLERITKIFILASLITPLFIKANALVFPYISGKVYLFRLLMLISFFLWVALMLKDKKYRPKFKNLLIMATILFLAGLTISAFFGVDLIYSFFSGFERGEGIIQFAFWILFFLMATSLLKSRKDWQVFIGLFIVASLATSIYGWFNYQYGGRVQGTFGNPAYLGGFMIFSIGFSIIAIEKKLYNMRFSTLLLTAFIVFFVITLIFTQTRGDWIGLGVGFAVFAISSVFLLRKENKKLAIITGCFLLIGLISLGLVFTFRNSDFIKNSETLSRLTEIAQFWNLPSIKERLLTWQIAIKGFKDKPIFGWGPENFGAIFNKYYDYRVGLEEPWFDKPHNVPLSILSEGGIFSFSLYLLWIFSIFFLISRIFKHQKLLAITLASIYSAYFTQGLFLFDNHPVYAGLFLFLSFVFFEHESDCQPENMVTDRDEKKRQEIDSLTGYSKYILTFTIVVVSVLIYTVVYLPYKGNALTLKYMMYSEAGLYDQALEFFKKATEINSPYIFLETRKRGAWRFSTALEGIDETIKKEDIESLIKTYKFLTPELEKAAERRPFDPQIYYVLGRIYRMSYEKLGQDDLEKAEILLKKSLNYSNLRIDYFNELAQVLVLKGKSEEAEKLVKDYIKNVDPNDPFHYLTIGHLYFVIKKYDQAMSFYEEARKRGHNFWESYTEYSRYLFTAEQLKDYQKVVDMSLEYLKNRGPDANTFFNLAVGYMELKDNQKAKEFFSKAVELNSEFEKYRPTFDNLE